MKESEFDRIVREGAKKVAEFFADVITGQIAEKVEDQYQIRDKYTQSIHKAIISRVLQILPALIEEKLKLK